MPSANRFESAVPMVASGPVLMCVNVIVADTTSTWGCSGGVVRYGKVIFVIRSMSCSALMFRWDVCMKRLGTYGL